VNLLASTWASLSPVSNSVSRCLTKSWDSRKILASPSDLSNFATRAKRSFSAVPWSSTALNLDFSCRVLSSANSFSITSEESVKSSNADVNALRSIFKPAELLFSSSRAVACVFRSFSNFVDFTCSSDNFFAVSDNSVDVLVNRSWWSNKDFSTSELSFLNFSRAFFSESRLSARESRSEVIFFIVSSLLESFFVWSSDDSFRVSQILVCCDNSDCSLVIVSIDSFNCCSVSSNLVTLTLCSPWSSSCSSLVWVNSDSSLLLISELPWSLLLRSWILSSFSLSSLSIRTFKSSISLFNTEIISSFDAMNAWTSLLFESVSDTLADMDSRT